MKYLSTILVVEDEELIRNLIDETLDVGEFTVVFASSGQEAIKLIEAAGSLLRLMVTDVNLGYGSLNGWQVARFARELNPDLAVVYMTGDSSAEWSSQSVPNSALLNKPFKPTQLLAAIAQVINPGDLIAT